MLALDDAAHRALPRAATPPARARATELAAIRESLRGRGWARGSPCSSRTRPASGSRRACCARSSSTRASLATSALMLGIVGFTAGLVGALAGRRAPSKLGRRRALIVFGALQTLAVPRSRSPRWGLVADALRGQRRRAPDHGMATAALFTAMMDVSRAGSRRHRLHGAGLARRRSPPALAAAFGRVSARRSATRGHFLLAAASRRRRRGGRHRSATRLRRSWTRLVDVIVTEESR